MSLVKIQRFLAKNPFLFALLLLLVALAANYSVQANMFEERPLNGNLRVFLPLMILAIGQTFVVIGGGIDLSVGSMVSMANTIIATKVVEDSTHPETALWVGAAFGACMLAGLFNGLCITYLRLQPIVTTYATSFVFAGIALYILPEPGGRLPREVTSFYRTPYEKTGIFKDIINLLEKVGLAAEPHEGVPVPLFVMLGLLLFWLLLSSTRYTQYLYAMGSKADAAYTTGVPVNLMRLSTYVVSGIFAAGAATALTFGIGTGNPGIGEGMTLESIVAVVLGGTRLSGGQGGIVGSMIGVYILGTIRNILSFQEDIPTWSRTLVDALIIIAALAGPGLFALLKNLFRRLVKND